MTGGVGQEVEHLLHLPLPFPVLLALRVALVDGMEIVVSILGVHGVVAQVIETSVAHRPHEKGRERIGFAGAKVRPYAGESIAHDVAARLCVLQQLQGVIIQSGVLGLEDAPKSLPLVFLLHHTSSLFIFLPLYFFTLHS